MPLRADQIGRRAHVHNQQVRRFVEALTIVFWIIVGKPVAGATFKQDLFARFAQVAKGLANGNRLEILEFLAQGERSVEELASVSGLSVANTSQHLQQLRQAGLVAPRKEGAKVFYRLSGADVIVLLNTLRGVAEHHLAEIERLGKPLFPLVPPNSCLPLFPQFLIDQNGHQQNEDQ